MEQLGVEAAVDALLEAPGIDVDAVEAMEEEVEAMEVEWARMELELMVPLFKRCLSSLLSASSIEETSRSGMTSSREDMKVE